MSVSDEFPFILPMDATDVLLAYFIHGWKMRFEFAGEEGGAELFRANAFLPVIVDVAEANCRAWLGSSLLPTFEADPTAIFNVRVTLPQPRAAELVVLVASASEIFQPRYGELRDLTPLFDYLRTPAEERPVLTEPLW